MWNITQPERSTAASGTQTETKREAGELEPDGRRGAERERDEEPDSEARRGDGEGEADHGSKR